MGRDISIVVQSRLGSTRVPGKMLKDFAGTTLVDILLKKLLKSKEIEPNQIYFCVGDDELISKGNEYPINVVRRSEASLNEEKDIATLFEWHTEIPTEHLVMVSGCNPLLEIETIDKFIREYRESKHEGAISVYESNNYFWNPEGKMLNKWPEGFTSMNTKFVDKTRVAAHCMYGSRVDLIPQGKWVTDKIPYEVELITMPELEAFDIDEPWQFTVAEKLYEIL